MTMPPHSRAAVFGALLLAGLCGPLSAAGQSVDAGDPFPVQGRPTDVHVRDAEGRPIEGAQVTVVFRPGSEVEHCVDLGQTGRDGRCAWTPEDAGIVRMCAEWERAGLRCSAYRNVSVRFRHVPASGVVVALVAGLILYGTVAYGFGKLRG